ncbi:right-handed parallel beta-helix repeat-containing protein, partial [Clostridiaceae bacterium UIB06]|nr:right-handed parallel beta-helix repeat-containing protein [Clostridiaceae bacterium UIB06]
NVHDVLTSGIRVTQHEDFIIDQYYTNVVVRNNVISKTGSDGMIVANCVNPLIENNACYDAGYNGNTADTKIIAGMWVCGTKNATFQNNEVARTKLFDSDGTAFDTDWGTGGTVVFQYNYTHGNGGGFWLDCAGINKDSTYNKTILRYNVSVDDLGYISRNGNENAELYNNVFYKSSGSLAGNFNGTASKHTLKNNIFNFQTSPDWAGAQYDNNCYYPAPANPSDKHAIYGNPDFVNPGLVGDGKSFADNYKIKATSVCINKGINIAQNGGKDYWGNSLYYGKPDIGANEYQGEANTMSTFSTDFSTTQGQGNWYYMEWNGSKYSNMTWDSSQNKWKGSYQYNLIWSPSQIHPDSNDSAVAWKATKAGTVRISGNPKKSNTGYDGVNVKIMKNDSQLWPASGWQFIGGTDTTGVTHEITGNVQVGDMIYFIVNKNGNNYGDETAWNPSIVYMAQ